MYTNFHSHSSYSNTCVPFVIYCLGCLYTANKYGVALFWFLSKKEGDDEQSCQSQPHTSMMLGTLTIPISTTILRDKSLPLETLYSARALVLLLHVIPNLLSLQVLLILVYAFTDPHQVLIYQ